MKRGVLPFCLGVAALRLWPPTAPRGADAFQKGGNKCTAAKDFGAILDAQPCQLEGLTCYSNGPSCNDTFDDDTQSCTDTYLPCTCTRSSGAANGTNNKWACPTAQCRAPDKRCTCQDDGLVEDNLECYKEGLQCPNYGNVVTCINHWNPTKKVCENFTAILGECDCYQGEWSCSYGDCVPSYECDPDSYPPDYTP